LFSIAFSEYPKQVKLAILFLCLAWLLHYVFYFSYLFDRAAGMQNREYLQLGVGLGICVIVAGIKRWARMMSIFFNLGMMGMYLFLAYVYNGAQHRETAALAALVFLLFTLATVFMLNREVARYFKERDPLPEPPGSQPPPSQDLTAGTPPSRTRKKSNKKNK
jgi:hypothetical protein